MLAILIRLFVSLAEICLGLRVIFRLFGANHIQLVQWVYQSSDNLLEPFRGIFKSQSVLTGSHILDFTALFGMLVYAFLGAVLTATLRALKPPKHHSKSKKD